MLILQASTYQQLTKHIGRQTDPPYAWRSAKFTVEIKMAFSYSERGMQLTQESEGCVLTAYQDQVGVWTIGYGHTGPTVVRGETITQDQADQLLASDVAGAVACVNGGVISDINQNQFDAMVDFTFNLGNHAFLTSTLLKLVNQNDFDGAALEFVKWDHAGGKVNMGLLKRREAEVALFQTPVDGFDPGADV
jgi:lysozyme